MHRHASKPAAPGNTNPVVGGVGVDVPELRQARALWQSNRFDQALELFETAARKYPQNLLALVDASRALGARFEIRKAEDLLGRLRKLGGQRPEVMHLAGQTYRMIYRPDEAMECFERVLTQTKEIPDAFLELAVLYERRHRLSDAFALVEECLRQAPDYREAELFKGRLLRRTKRGEEAHALFLRLAGAATEAGPLLRSQAWAEVAQDRDHAGEYEGAMDAIRQSKALLLERDGAVRRESDRVLDQLLRMNAAVSPAHFQRWTKAVQAQAKVAVLTGFPRSGTTLLEQVLDSHSGLVSSDEREAFARDIFPAMWLAPGTPEPSVEALDGIEPHRVGQLRTRYLDYMSAALNAEIGGRVHLDKNPPMTLLLPAFLRLFPEARLLIALRDPRDVVLSCFMQYLPLNPNSVCFLTLERAAKRYAADMGSWLNLREKISAPWLEVKYERTVTDLEVTARRALDFLGLEWDAGVLEYRERLRAKAVRSPTYEAVTQPLYTKSIGRWQHYEKFFESLRPLLDPLVRAFGY